MEQFYWRNDTQNYRNECKKCKTARGTRWSSANRAKSNSYKTRWREANRGKHNETSRVWGRTPEGLAAYRRKNQKRRALKLSLPNVVYGAQNIYERDNGVCSLCGFYVSRENFHIEHTIPLQVDMQLLSSYGIIEHPGNVPHNVSVAHPSCNTSKGNRLSQEDVARYLLWSYLYKE